MKEALLDAQSISLWKLVVYFPVQLLHTFERSLLGTLFKESRPLLSPAVLAGNTLASCDRYPMVEKASPV